MEGLTLALPLSNIGRFSSSTIWMRRPSAVMSSRICDLSAASLALPPICASTLSLSSCKRSCSARFCSALKACRLIVLRCGGFSPLLTWPPWRDRSVPPPLTTCDESPEPLPPISATFSGELKKSAMPFLSPSVVEPRSHISRKNAIIAVTKSA